MVWTVRNGKLMDLPAPASVNADPPQPGDTGDTETDPATNLPIPKAAPGAPAAPGATTTAPAAAGGGAGPGETEVPSTGGRFHANGDGTYTDTQTGRIYRGRTGNPVYAQDPKTGVITSQPGPIILGTEVAGPKSGGGADPNFNPNNPPPPGIIRTGGRILVVTPGVVQPDGSVAPPHYQDLGPDPDAPASKNVSADTQAQIDAAKQKNLDDLAFQYAQLTQQGKQFEANQLLQKGIQLGIIDGQPTLDAIIRKADIALRTGDLTGIYNNQSTVQAGANAGFVTLPNGQRVPTAQSTQAAGYIQLPDGTKIPTLAQGEATGMITLPDGSKVPSFQAQNAVGTVNGQPTVQAGEAIGTVLGKDTIARGSLMGTLNGAPTLAAGEAVGMVNGQPTVQAGQMMGRFNGQNTLQRDVEEAQSRRADVATNLQRQGQGWDQWMKERQDTEELSRQPQDWLSYAIRSGGGQVPQGVGLWDQLQRVNANRPENVETFLNRQNQAPAAAPKPGPAPGAAPAVVPAAPAAPANPAATATTPVAAGNLAGASAPSAPYDANAVKAGLPQGWQEAMKPPAAAAPAATPATALVPNAGASAGAAPSPYPHWHDDSGQAIPVYDLGGTVPGTPDQHQLAVLQGGEQVIPPQQGVVQQNFYPGPSSGQAGPRYDLPQPGMPPVRGDMLNQAPVPAPAVSPPPVRIAAMNNFAAPPPPSGQAPTNLSATVGGGSPAPAPSGQGQGNYLPTAGDFRKLPFLPGALRAAITPVGGATGAGGQGGNRYNGSGISPYASRTLGGFRPLAAQTARSLNPSFNPALGTIANQTGNLAGDMPWYRKPQ